MTEDIKRESERARELERLALEATEESKRRAQEARGRIDEQLRSYLQTVDPDEENTGIHRLDELVKKAGSPLPPGQEPEPAPATLRPVAIDSASPRSERVLVVEDDASIRDILAEELRDEGYQVRVAVDGIDALEKILRDKPMPDVIILDLGLPVLRGPGVIAALRIELDAVPPILIISAGANISRLLSESPEISQEYVFAKPFDMDHLRKVVRQRIAEWRSLPKRPF